MYQKQSKSVEKGTLNINRPIIKKNRPITFSLNIFKTIIIDYKN